MPELNASDNDRAIMQVNSLLVKLLNQCFENLGVALVFNQTFSQMLDHTV